MNKIQLGVDGISSTPLILGFEGENVHTQIVIYWTSLYADYPTAAATMVVKPPVGDAYPKAITQDGNKITWNITDTDTANAGNGQYQLTFTSGSEIIKTYIGNFAILPSLTGSGSEPTPVADWITAANAVLAQVEAYTTTFALKNNTELTGSLSLGRKANTTVGTGSVAIGSNATASGDYSSALGGATASGLNSHADGSGIASGTGSHAEGTGTASGQYSHAEGAGTTASGKRSHSEGNSTTASGDNSHADGYGTFATRRSQHVFGEYNVTPEGSASTKGEYVEIVGNGTASNSRSNARALDWQGNEYLKGTLYVNCDSEGYSGSPVATQVKIFNPVGTTPSIDGVDNARYICGEVSTISITPPESGIIDVIFTSGSTPAVLTVPNTVKFPDWFDPSDLDTNKTYEINILDGVYAVVASWT